VHVINEFSYVTTRQSGDGWVLCGDAFGFLDPMYSTGVLLALRSAEFAADNVAEALREGDTSGERLGRFAPRVSRGMWAFRQLVYSFYNREFSFGRFLRAHPEHRLAIISILVGDVFDMDFGPLFRDIRAMVGIPGEEEGNAKTWAGEFEAAAAARAALAAAGSVSRA
jgi:flavin-dependent dehydrogenase